jgi:hypothetical protein
MNAEQVEIYHAVVAALQTAARSASRAPFSPRLRGGRSASLLAAVAPPLSPAALPLRNLSDCCRCLSATFPNPEDALCNLSGSAM